jgi:hypothetical protein
MEQFNKSKTHSILSKAVTQIRQKQAYTNHSNYLEQYNSMMSNSNFNNNIDFISTPKSPSQDYASMVQRGFVNHPKSAGSNGSVNYYGSDILKHKGSLVEINKKTLYQLIQNKTLSPKSFSKLASANPPPSGKNQCKFLQDKLINLIL